jgi:hypothetical protein
MRCVDVLILLLLSFHRLHCACQAEASLPRAMIQSDNRPPLQYPFIYLNSFPPTPFPPLPPHPSSPHPEATHTGFFIGILVWLSVLTFFVVGITIWILAKCYLKNRQQLQKKPEEMEQLKKKPEEMVEETTTPPVV